MNELPWSPAFLSQAPAVWVDAASGVSVSGTDSVSDWANMGSTGGSYLQATSLKRPQLIDAALNGQPVVRFDGENDGLRWVGNSDPVTNGISHLQVFAVVKKRTDDVLTGATLNRAIFVANRNNGSYRTGLMVSNNVNGNQNQPQIGVRPLDPPSSVIEFHTPGAGYARFGEWMLLRGWWDGVASELGLSYNGTVVSTQAPLITATSTSATNGSASSIGSAGGGNTDFADVDLATLVVYAGTEPLAEQDIRRLEGWAAHKYGLTANLPLDHPYKTEPPTYSLNVSTPHPTVIQPATAQPHRYDQVVVPPHPTVIQPATAQPHRYDQVVVPRPIATRNLGFDQNARGRIVGTVKRKDTPSNVPLKRRVRLYRDIDGLFIAETWSDDAGNFVFERIEEGMAYTTIAYDYQNTYRAVAADNLTLANGSVELM